VRRTPRRRKGLNSCPPFAIFPLFAMGCNRLSWGERWRSRRRGTSDILPNESGSTGCWRSARGRSSTLRLRANCARPCSRSRPFRPRIGEVTDIVGEGDVHLPARRGRTASADASARGDRGDASALTIEHNYPKRKKFAEILLPRAHVPIRAPAGGPHGQFDQFGVEVFGSDERWSTSRPSCWLRILRCAEARRHHRQAQLDGLPDVRARSARCFVSELVHRHHRCAASAGEEAGAQRLRAGSTARRPDARRSARRSDAGGAPRRRLRRALDAVKEGLTLAGREYVHAVHRRRPRIDY